MVFCNCYGNGVMSCFLCHVQTQLQVIPVLVCKINIGEILAIHPEHPECIKSAVYSPRQGNNYHIPARLHGSYPLLNAFFLVIF